MCLSDNPSSVPPPKEDTRSHMARLSRKRPHLIISGYEKEWGHYYKKSVSGLGPCRVGKVWGLYSFKMGLVAKVTSRQLLPPRICDNSSCLSGNIFFLSAKWLEPYLGIIKWVIGQSLGEPIIVNRPIIIVADKESLVTVRTPLVLLESSLISLTARYFNIDVWHGVDWSHQRSPVPSEITVSAYTFIFGSKPVSSTTGLFRGERI